MDSVKMFNPTPISKFLMTVFLAFNLTATLSEFSQLFVVLFIALFFALNDRAKTALKVIAFMALSYCYCVILRGSILLLSKIIF